LTKPTQERDHDWVYAMPLILLVDDHPLFHEGLASAFARLAPELEIVGAETSAAGLELLRTQPIELALVDLVLPNSDGLSTIAAYAAEAPHVPRVLISGREEPELVRKARAAGASGFIRKSLPLTALLDALRRILDGNAYFELESAADHSSERLVGARAGAAELTLRQLEVLRLLGAGWSNKEISAQLCIAERTVRAHLTELFRALGASSRTQAVLVAQRLGLLAEP
jgi:DNA-binding NarL/FixJ family response regulator